MSTTLPQRALPRAVPLFALLLFFQSSFAQLRVSGSLCVSAGAEYLYTVAGGKGAPLPVTVCLTGGTFANGSSCLQSPADAFRIVWQQGAARASLSIHSAEGDTLIYLARNGELAGGEISSAKKSQVFDINRTAIAITCTPANGGACNARYSYQWQSSDNCVEWKDIDGAAEENLKMATVPGQTTYYRRRVLERASNTITYSDVATVFIVPVGLKSADVVTRQ